MTDLLLDIVTICGLAVMGVGIIGTGLLLLVGTVDG